jgi:hypothetical protein
MLDLLSYSEEGGKRFLRKGGNELSDCTAYTPEDSHRRECLKYPVPILYSYYAFYAKKLLILYFRSAYFRRKLKRL